MSFWLDFGINFELEGRHEDALECYNKATDIGPDNARAWAVKAACLLRLERHQESSDCRKRAHYLDPENF